MIVVWGSPDDPPVASVLHALQGLGAPAMLLDDDRVRSLHYDLELGPRPSGWLELDGRRVPLEEIEGIYLRPGRQGDVGAANAAALLAVAGSIPATVVNRPAGGRSNLSKPFQLTVLAGLGLAIPDTLVTTDPAAATAFLARHGRIIYKSISGVRSIVAAIDAQDGDRLERIGHGPVQLQQWIDGVDVRVHVVGDRWFASSVASDATDYRYASTEGRPVLIAPLELPTQLGRCLVSVTRQLGLLVAGVDLRRNERGEWYCFEVNPSPGFTYYEAHTGQPIADAIAALLMRGPATRSG